MRRGVGYVQLFCKCMIYADCHHELRSSPTGGLVEWSENEMILLTKEDYDTMAKAHVCAPAQDRGA